MAQVADSPEKRTVRTDAGEDEATLNKAPELYRVHMPDQLPVAKDVSSASTRQLTRRLRIQTECTSSTSSKSWTFTLVCVP